MASLRTQAVRDGDEYVINGQKIYTSAIQYADYVWLAARTDPDAPKHKGLSVFIVPVDTPGFRWTPLATIAGDITVSTYYEDVRVPAENLVGEENHGWKLITNQLNHERVAICPASASSAAWTRSGAGCRTRGRRSAGDQARRGSSGLARVHAKVEVLKLLNWKVAWAADKGLNPADASATKVYGTELALDCYRLLMDVVGQAGYLAEGSPGAVRPGPARAPGSGPDHLHLRRRDQRDPARHHRHGRPGHARPRAESGARPWGWWPRPRSRA